MEKWITVIKQTWFYVAALALALMVFSVAACQSGPQGYKSNPEAIAFNEQGIDLYTKGAFDKAILNFDRALEKDPSNPAVYFNKAQALDAMKRFDQAVASYDLAIQLDPNFADAWNYRGVSYFNKSQFDKAIESIDKAIAIDGNNAVYWEKSALAILLYSNFKILGFKRRIIWIERAPVVQRYLSLAGANSLELEMLYPARSHYSRVCRGIAFNQLEHGTVISLFPGIAGRGVGIYSDDKSYAHR
jgi:tetratricopeptide (TPR) repeat protein